MKRLLLLPLLTLTLLSADNPFLHDWSTNSPGVKCQFAWNFGSPYDQWGVPATPPDGTELWGAFSPDGFKSGPTWKDLENGDATNRWKIAEVYGSSTNAWASFPMGHYYLAVYAYCHHNGSTNYYTNYSNVGVATVVTNINEAFRIRSEPSNIVELKVPKQRANLHLLSSEVLPGLTNIESTIEIDTTGSAAKFFTLYLHAVPPLPPMPPTP